MFILKFQFGYIIYPQQYVVPLEVIPAEFMKLTCFGTINFNFEDINMKI